MNPLAFIKNILAYRKYVEVLLRINSKQHQWIEEYLVFAVSFFYHVAHIFHKGKYKLNVLMSDLEARNYLWFHLKLRTHHRPAGRSFFAVFYCLLAHVRPLQLKEAQYEMSNRCKAFIFHSSILICEQLKVIQLHPSLSPNYSFLLYSHFFKWLIVLYTLYQIQVPWFLKFDLV